MAVYTPINESDLDALLSDFDLGASVSCQGIADGVENSNFRLETERGLFILTLYERRVREADLPYFLDLMRWLADRRFPCPPPVADRGGALLKRVRGRPAALVSFLPGAAIADPTPRQCRAAGAALARLHLAGAGFPGDRDNTLGRAAWPSLFKGLAPAADRLRAALSREVADDLAELTAAWPDGLPRGAIHADFFPDNVFFVGDEVSAAIDFYIACTDAYAYDLAVALAAWSFGPDGRFQAEGAAAMISGYHGVRALDDAERAALPLLSRGACMRFFLTRLADWNDTRPGALVRLKDPLEYEARLAFFRTHPDYFFLILRIIS